MVRIECLNLSCCSQISADEVCLVLSQIGHPLISLELWRVTSLSATGISLLAQNFPQLKELDIGWCSMVNSSNGCLVELAQGCRQLEKLFLTALRQTSDRDILEIAANLTNLKQFDIMGTRLVTFQSVDELLQRCPDIELLDISYCEQLEDKERVGELLDKYPDCHILHTFQ